MDNIEALDRDYNIGGLSLIEFIPTENVTSMDEPVDMVVEAIQFHIISSMFSMYATIDTAELKYVQESTVHGEKFNVSVKGFIPKLELNKDLNFEEMKTQQFILRVTDENGKLRWCGSIESPMSFTIIAGSGTRSADRNGTDILFYGESEHIPYYNS